MKDASSYCPSSEINEEEIIKRILLQREGLTREEIVNAIREKEVASNGLLTRKAAAKLVAAGFGLSITCQGVSFQIPIEKLSPGLGDVSFSGHVLFIDRPKQFSRVNGNGKLIRMMVADETGIVNVLLWDNKVNIAESIHRKDIVKINHGYVRKARHGGVEVHIRERGTIHAEPMRDNLLSFQDLFTRIKLIDESRKWVNVEGVIKDINPPSTFKRRNGTQGKVMRIVLQDESGMIPAVFWNRKANEIIECKVGMLISLINAKVKTSYNGTGLELHVDGFTGIDYSEPKPH